MGTPWDADSLRPVVDALPKSEVSFTYPVPMEEDELAAVRHALLTGDNRLKQGAGAAKVRESYEYALELARAAGVEERIRPLVELRLADLARLEAEPPRPAPPES